MQASVDLYGDVKMPLLAPEVLKELIERAREGDETAKQQVVLSNIGLARKAALRYHRESASYGVDIRDLFQEGLIGLNRAVELFDCDRGYTFSTYAHNWIQQAIIGYLRKNSMILNTQECTHGTRLVAQIRAEFNAKHGRQPTPQEICQIGKITPSALERYSSPEVKVSSYHQMTARNKQTGKEVESELLDMLLDPADDEFSSRMDMVLDLCMAIDDLKLTEIETQVMEMRFGFGEYSPMSVQAIAKEIDRRPRDVNSILTQIVSRLRSSVLLGSYTED